VVTVLSTVPTGDLLLDETLMMIKKTEDAGERTSAETWLNYLSGACPWFSLLFLLLKRS
jgi:Golgi phosphoprotein 3